MNYILILTNILLLFIIIIAFVKNSQQKKKYDAQMETAKEEGEYLLDEIQRLKENEEKYLSGQENLANQRLSALEQEYERRREEIRTELEQKKSMTEVEFQSWEKKYAIETEKLEEDKVKLEAALEDLKSKKEKSIEQLRSEVRKANEKDFHKIQLGTESKEDIAVLLEVEKRIHNKDVLRKLIYKTYIESEMNETFNRIGVITEPGIYKIEHIETGKTYIGQSTNVRNRLREHVKSSLGISSIAHQAVHEAIYEEGFDNFTFEVIEACDRAQLNNREKYWIDFYQSNEWGYNRTRGGS